MGRKGCGLASLRSPTGWWLHAKADALAQRGHKVDQPPSAAIEPTAPALGRRQPSQSHNPTGKATHCILSRLRLPTNAVRCAPVGPAKRCPTHNPYAPSIRAACRPATHRHQLDKPQFDYGPFPISASYPIYGIIKSNVLHFLPPGLYQGPSAGRNYEKETCNY